MEKLQKRVNALKNIQLEIDQAESKLSEEIIQLECKHSSIFDGLYKKREAIVNGEHEPSEEEAKWEYENGVLEDETKEGKIDASKPGISGFWLRVLDTARLTSGIILDGDKPILKHLKNIKVKQNSEKPFGFTLEFHFEENEFFKNRVLTKSYEFTVQKDKRNPLMTSHNALYKCVGCKIEWNEGKSPVKEGEDGDDDGSGSFFDFFRTHTSDGVRPAFKEKDAKNGNGNGKSQNEDEDEVELEHLFELDYEIGKFIKDMIIPKAVLYYTGEITEMEETEMDEFDTEESEDDDNEDDDDESDDEPDIKPTKKKVKTERE